MTNDWVSTYLFVTIWLIAVPVFGLKMLSAVVFSKYWKEADAEKTNRNTVYHRSSKKMWSLGISKAKTLSETKNLLSRSARQRGDEEEEEEEEEEHEASDKGEDDDGKVKELRHREYSGGDGSFLTFLCNIWPCRVLKSMYTTMMNDEWQIKKRKLDKLRKSFLKSRHLERHQRSVFLRTAPKKPKPKKKPFSKIVKRNPNVLWAKVRHLLPEIADAGLRTRHRPPWIRGGGYQRPYPVQDEQ